MIGANILCDVAGNVSVVFSSRLGRVSVNNRRGEAKAYAGTRAIGAEFQGVPWGGMVGQAPPRLALPSARA